MQLSKSIDKVKRQSLTDNLTDLYNRSYLEPFLERELEHAKKKNQMLSVIMVDMDHFKHINDTYGHIVGDHVLTIFAQVILKCIRKTDVIARYGGDEFVVVLPNTDTETAKCIAERIRHDVSEMYIPPVEGVVISSIQCSVGVSTYPVHCDSRNSLIYTSDLALYMAKRSGRNCIKVYENEFTLG
jgi:diguanylate cyclase (GGDEF)-like protein